MVVFNDYLKGCSYNDHKNKIIGGFDMNFKNQASDSGSYVNGIYTTKNGYSGLGLNCPKGTRLYDLKIRKGVFFEPEDTPNDEEFRKITQEVCPDIMPYYAISNYGRLMNINSGKVMKPNYRPNGYEYYCLAAENSKTMVIKLRIM